jgi:hypothetical protein
MEGRQGNLLVRTQIRSLRMPRPLDRSPDAPDAGHPLCRFVPCLVALGGSDSTGGFRLRTPSIAGSSAIVGPILDIVVISYDLEGTSCEELECHVSSCSLRPFYGACELALVRSLLSLA